MRRPITASSLRHRCEIRLKAEVPAPGGQTALTYGLVATVFGKLTAIGGQTLVGSVQVGERVTHRLYIPIRDDLTTEHVIERNGRRYQVRRSAIVGDRDRFLEVWLEDNGEIDATAPFRPFGG